MGVVNELSTISDTKECNLLRRSHELRLDNLFTRRRPRNALVTWYRKHIKVLNMEVLVILEDRWSRGNSEN